MSKFCFFGASNDDPGTSATDAYIVNSANIAWSTTEARRRIPLSDDVTVTLFKIILDTAPGSGNTRTFILRKNGTDTAISITISNAELTGVWEGSVSFAEGDLINIQQTATGTPAAPGNMYWYGYMDAAGSKTLLMGAHSNVASQSATNYGDPFGATTWSTTTNDQATVVPLGCTVTKARVFTSSAPGASKSYAVSLRINDTTDALTTTVIGSGTTQGNASGSQALSAGDIIQIKCVPSGTPTSVGLAWCFTYEPTTSGEAFYGFGPVAALSTTNTQYNQPLGVGAGWGTVESSRLMKFPACTIKNLYVKLSAAPGSGAPTKTRTITWRDNSGASTLSVVVSGTNTTGNDTTHTVTHAVDNAISIQVVPANTPAASDLHIGYVLVTPQAVASSYGYVY